MPDDMPADWFRPTNADEAPTRPEAAQAPVTEPQAVADEPAEVELTQERYTTQFKPGYQPTGRPRAAKPSPPAHAGTRQAAPASPWPGTSEPPPRPPHPQSVSGPTAPRIEVSGPPSQRSFLGRHRVLVTVSALVLALVVGLSAGQLLHERTSRADSTPTTSGSTSSSSQPSTDSASASDAQPWAGNTAALRPATVAATCTAPDATDAQGKTVGYAAGNVIDNEPATAWRCNGDGVGESLTFTFPKGAVLVGVGLQNGYVKTPGSDQLYDQYRKVTRVRWTMADGSWFTQSLSDNNPSLQQVLTPPLTLEGPVTMTIEQVSKPGTSGDSTRDAVLISTVSFVTKA